MTALSFLCNFRLVFCSDLPHFLHVKNRLTGTHHSKVKLPKTQKHYQDPNLFYLSATTLAKATYKTFPQI